MYSIGKPKSNRYGQVSGSFFPRKRLFRNGERKLRVTESFNDSFDSDSISFSDSTFVSSGVSIKKTDLVGSVYNIGIESTIVGFASETQIYRTTTPDIITSNYTVDNTPPPPPVQPPPPPAVVATPIEQVIPEQTIWVYVDLGSQDSSVYGWVESPLYGWVDSGGQGSFLSWELLPEYDTGGYDEGQDPLAQTFFIDAQVYPYGVFVESLDLFFRSKDTNNMPVHVEIRPTVNASPHAYFWYAESVVEKYPDDINVSEIPSVNDSSTKTNFQLTLL